MRLRFVWAGRLVPGQSRHDLRQNLFGLRSPARRRRAERRLVGAGRDMNDLVAALLQSTQKLRQHFRCRSTGIMHQQNAALGAVEPLEYEIKFGLRRQ